LGEPPLLNPVYPVRRHGRRHHLAARTAARWLHGLVCVSAWITS